MSATLYDGDMRVTEDSAELLDIKTAARRMGRGQLPLDVLLAMWMAANGWTDQRLADELTERLGRRINRPQITHWRKRWQEDRGAIEPVATPAGEGKEKYRRRSNSRPMPEDVAEVLAELTKLDVWRPS